MTAMLMPMVNSYFAIYTLENPVREPVIGRAARGMNWDLHATATDRTMAISHARMLAMQPGVSEVHVKQVTENLSNGLVSVRDVKRCKRANYDRLLRWVTVPALAIASASAIVLAVFF